MTHTPHLRISLAIFVLAGLVAALLGFFMPATTALAATPDQSFEKCIRDRHNAARKDAGLPPLESRSDLVSYARRHTDAMIAAGKIFHSDNLGSATSGWTLLGENVGVGGSCDLHNAFMNSPGHRANILNPKFTAIGVGGAQAPNGQYFVTVVFAAYKDSPAPTTTTPPPPTTTAPPRPTTTVPPTTTTTASPFEALPDLEWGTLITELIKMALMRSLPVSVG